MSEKNINREFIEAMMRLKRDTINFQKLEIATKLSITLWGCFVIIFNIENNCWDIQSDNLLNHKWNPTLEEIMEFLSNYEVNDIRDCLELNTHITINGYSSINSISLESKFKQILGLMKLDENLMVDKISSINIETDDNRSLVIIYNPSKFVYTYIDGNTGNQAKMLLDSDLIDILKNSNYWNVFQSLNLYYKQLNRKI